jgi:hypothetical protein
LHLHCSFLSRCFCPYIWIIQNRNRCFRPSHFVLLPHSVARSVSIQCL